MRCFSGRGAVFVHTRDTVFVLLLADVGAIPLIRLL